MNEPIITGWDEVKKAPIVKWTNDFYWKDLSEIVKYISA